LVEIGAAALAHVGGADVKRKPQVFEGALGEIFGEHPDEGVGLDEAFLPPTRPDHLQVVDLLDDPEHVVR
jgi:hypothetical protein